MNTILQSIKYESLGMGEHRWESIKASSAIGEHSWVSIKASSSIGEHRKLSIKASSAIGEHSWVSIKASSSIGEHRKLSIKVFFSSLVSRPTRTYTRQLRPTLSNTYRRKNLQTWNFRFECLLWRENNFRKMSKVEARLFNLDFI